AVEKARGMATAAFRLRRELDDAYIEPVTKQREMALQIIAYSEAAQTQLANHDRSFSSLRVAELEAPASLTALGEHITETSARIAPARKTLSRLAADYRPAIADEHKQAIAEAVTRLDAAKKTVAAAQKNLSPAGVNAVVADV